MPRRKRPNWSKITITVSSEVAQDIRVEAVKRRIEMGTFVDQAVRNFICADQSLNITFLEDVNRLCKDTSDLGKLLESIKEELPKHLHSSASTDSFWLELQAWQRTLRVPKPWKRAFYRVMRYKNTGLGLPRIYTNQLVEEGWFDF